ncbi:MAG: RNB domain-containing ribonuclease, partial [Chlamydiae bacterium]|nr:RNB domain-containing ribonuclease [Chlamydiota bacterium]
MKNKNKKSKQEPKIDTCDALRDSVESKLRSFLSSSSYSPMSQSQLMKELELPKEEETLAKKIITEFLLSGTIEAKKKKLSLIKPKIEQKQPLHSGTLRMHPRGFGFVVPDATSLLKEDVFIPKNLVGSAVDGDIVEIAVYPSKKKDKGPEGKVLTVLKRSRSHLAGIVLQIVDEGTILGFIPLFGIQRLAHIIPSAEIPVRVGDRVILKVLEWGNQSKPPVCEISSLLGHISNPSIDIPAALEEFCIRGPFPDEVINEAKNLGMEVSDEDKKGRLDLTKIETFTIDPETAKDFDDALSLLRDENGFTLYVHIADVAHYVKQSSALDKEALLRGNSTYFPGKCVPMLPEELSNHLCSLKPDVIRLCITVIVYFDNQGTVTNHQIKRSYIHSKRRFTYEEAKAVLDGKLESPHSKTLHNMKDLCLLLKKKRYDRGSIDFALPEVVLELDKEGMPTGFKIVEYDISHQLVEEFMLKANEVVAKSLADQGKPVVFRIHEEPAPESLEDFGTLARALGFPLSDSHDIKQLQKLFEEAKESEFAGQLSVAFIRSMKLAY